MSTSDIFLLINAMLFMVLLAAASFLLFGGGAGGGFNFFGNNAVAAGAGSRIDNMTLPATAIAGGPSTYLVSGTAPGPTFHSAAETGVIDVVTPMNPSWPYVDFPKSAPGSIRWGQSSFDSAPYFGSKLGGMKCHHCPKLREGMETNVVPAPETAPAVAPATIPAAQNPQPSSGIQPAVAEEDQKKKKEGEEDQQPAATKTTTTSTEPAPADTKTSTTTTTSSLKSTPPPLPSAPAATTTTTQPQQQQPVVGNGAEVIGAPTVSKLAPGAANPVSTVLKTGADLPATETTTKTKKGAVNGSVAQTVRPMPANEITETVKSRLQVINDLTAQGQNDMAPSLYLLTLLQQKQLQYSNPGMAASASPASSAAAPPALPANDRVRVL